MRAIVHVTVLLGMVLVAACSETRRSLGEECLKDDDCLSGICSQLKCAASPPLLDGSPGPDLDSGAPDAAPDAGFDAGEAAAPFDAPADG